MVELEKLVKVSSKGQITLPKAVRERLRSDVIRIVVEDGQIRIEPVADVAGSLKRYAKSYTPLERIREQVWEEVVRDKHAGG